MHSDESAVKGPTPHTAAVLLHVVHKHRLLCPVRPVKAPSVKGQVKAAVTDGVAVVVLLGLTTDTAERKNAFAAKSAAWVLVAIPAWMLPV